MTVGTFSGADSCGTHAELVRWRVTTHEAVAGKEAWYMAWIVVVPPSPRHPHERYQVCYQQGKRHRSAGIFPVSWGVLARRWVSRYPTARPMSLWLPAG